MSDFAANLRKNFSSKSKTQSNQDPDLSPNQISTFFEILSDEIIKNVSETGSEKGDQPENQNQILSKNFIKNSLLEVSSLPKQNFDIKTNKLGFYNLGNTCFMNSALQCLYTIPEFCQILDSRNWDDEHQMKTKYYDQKSGIFKFKYENKTIITAPMCWASKDVLNGLKTSKNSIKCVNPTLILKEMCKVDRIFCEGRQQDASEFLTTYLDKLHEESKHLVLPKKFRNKFISLSCSDNLHGETDTCGQAQGDRNHEKEPEKFISPFSETFDGDLTSTVKCLHCKNKSLTKEPFQILTLSIPYKPVGDGESRLGSCDDDDNGDHNQTNESTFKDGEDIENVKNNENNEKEFSSSDELSPKKPIKFQIKPASSTSQNSNPPQNPNLQVQLLSLSRKIFMLDLLSKIFFFFMYTLIINPIRQTFTSVSGIFSDPKISLKDCINHFCKVDSLENENMYSCGKCKKLRNGERYYSLGNMPKVLIFHLKRFRHFGDYSDAGVKITKHVHFQEFYSFNNQTFKLYSVLMHHGHSSHFGHYTSYVRSTIDDQFYHCDDKYVEPVCLDDVLSAQAYVLFYRKVEKEIVESSLDVKGGRKFLDDSSVVRFNLKSPNARKSKQKERKSSSTKNNLAYLNKTLNTLQPSQNSCFISQINLFQIIFNLKPLHEITLNEDVICQHGKVNLRVKSQAMLAISIELWKSLCELVGVERNHYLVIDDDYCGICKELEEAERKAESRNST